MILAGVAHFFVLFARLPVAMGMCFTFGYGAMGNIIFDSEVDFVVEHKLLLILDTVLALLVILFFIVQGPWKKCYNIHSLLDAQCQPR